MAQSKNIMIEIIWPDNTTLFLIVIVICLFVVALLGFTSRDY